MQPKPLHILISPLDWGLGHASRCIPIISQLIKAGHKITVAGYGRSLILLQKEFPNLDSVVLQGFSPSYSRTGNTLLHLVLLLPQFIGTIFREHSKLKSLIARYHFDIIISDNRYGLWNKQVRSIIITHQVMIKTPGWLRFAEYPIYLVSRLMISCFDECWIPDYEESPGLSGDLSHRYPLPKNAKFIGPLSRFNQSEPASENEVADRKIIAIISGPEPQRSLFEDLLISQLTETKTPTTIITGKPESENTVVTESTLKILPHLSTEDLNSLVYSSSLVICRSGYSSIMDLEALGAKALFIPTPGQTEQIYLAELHYKAGKALFRTQEKMDLKVDIDNALKYMGFKNEAMKPGIVTAIADLTKK
jgi:uncharacterized protein (TIGR00661 family)